MKVLRVLIIVAIVLIIGLFFAWKSAPALISSSLSKKMKVDVKIQAIDLSTDEVSVHKIEIGNPKGSQLPTAFSAKSINVHAPLSAYIKDPIVIDEISVDKVYVSLEIATPTSPAGNWVTLMDNLKKSSPKETTSGKSILIKKLILSDISAELVTALNVAGAKKLGKIKRLEFRDVSSESGVSADQIISVILEKTLTSILKENDLENVIEETIESPKNILDKLTSPFK